MPFLWLIVCVCLHISCFIFFPYWVLCRVDVCIIIPVMNSGYGFSLQIQISFMFLLLLALSGVDPKSVVCAFFKQGTCRKGDKCKFSHDLTLERKSEKRSIYEEGGQEKGESFCYILVVPAWGEGGGNPPSDNSRSCYCEESQVWKIE